MPPTPRAFTPRDLRLERQITDFDLSPDGETIVYARRDTEQARYVSNLWRVPVRGGRPERLTSASAVDAGPRVSPDGASLLFVSTRADDTPRCFVLPLSGGEPRILPAPEGPVGGAQWSPDGRSVLFQAGAGVQRFIVGSPDDPTARRIDVRLWRMDGMGVRDQRMAAWTVDAGGRGRPRRVTPADLDAGAPRWAGARRIGFLADRRDDPGDERSRVYAVSAGGGAVREVAALPGTVWAAEWSPRGRLAMVGVEHEDNLPWRDPVLVVRDGSELVRLGGRLDRPVALMSYGDLIPGEVGPHLCWEDEEHLIAVVTDGGRAHAVRFGLDGSEEWLTEGDVVVSDVRCAGGRVVALANVDGGPADLFELEGGRARRITRDGSRWFGPFRREVEQVGAFGDGAGAIDAWMLRGGRGRRPVVLQIHGGPHASHAPLPWLEMTALASAGISVVWANPAGSLSYGARHASSLYGRWGEPDSRQLLALLDRLAGRGLIDAGRVGALGLSYGGFETLWLAGRHPRRFAAAVAENPVSSYLVEAATWDYGGYDFAGIGTLPDDAQAFWERSPASRITRFRGPLLLLQCEDDMRCPPANSELVYVMRKTQGLPVEMIRYPGESHVMLAIGRPDRRRDRLERIVDWFSRSL
ncbi:MAG TPA: prolyl oligopeptidase family serine peptidase [Gaiellales bacterium]